MSPDAFKPFGPDHLAGLALIAAACAALVLGDSLLSRRRLRMGWVLGWLLVAWVAATYGRLALVGGLSWSHSLPLHLCDLTVGACILALFTRSRTAFELTYYWGLMGALPALFFPDILQGFPAPRCILFFIGHGMLVVANVWLIAGERCLPQPGSLLRAFLGLNLYAVLVGALNWMTGWNYGYLCQRPSQPSPVDHMGPWPWYIFVADAIALAGFAALYLPWALRSARGSVEECVQHT